LSGSGSVRNALKTLKSLNYKYIPLKFKKDTSYGNLKLPSSFDEAVIRDFLDTKKDLEPFEGLYRYVPKDSKISSQYKFLILKKDFTYFGFIVEANCVGCQNWKNGDVKFKMTEGAVSEILDVSWKYPVQERKRAEKIIFTSKVGGNLLEGSNISLLKLYPKAISNSKKKTSKNGEWAGNGSGVIISKSGHIITNHHVIKDAEKIEVEFMIEGELQKFNAEVVQVDKTNDLAVLKIFDMNFDGVSEPPYNFKFRGSDVGTKVYAFGYPMALTVMGKEIKVTDGMISSKSGFDGDITTYQITAPIQGGNSGGPLFDEQANLIGINSSGIRKDIADNVAYSIKTSYVSNLLDVLPKSIELPSSTKLKSLPLTEQIKEISKYVVLVKVK
ncbi:serine protease, partial [Flavobacteriaceae bacterium]|nr:serine protease [Flavobacteriaceae bacterium]